MIDGVCIVRVTGGQWGRTMGVGGKEWVRQWILLECAG